MGAYYRYYRNRACACMRCRVGSGIGPAVLITLGVLFLFDTMQVMRFHYTWPVLLIVIGVMKVLAYSASAEGHVAPFWQGGAVPPAAQGQVITPPAQPPQSGYTPPGGQGGGSRG